MPWWNYERRRPTLGGAHAAKWDPCSQTFSHGPHLHSEGPNLCINVTWTIKCPQMGRSTPRYRKAEQANHWWERSCASLQVRDGPARNFRENWLHIGHRADRWAAIERKPVLGKASARRVCAANLSRYASLIQTRTRRTSMHYNALSPQFVWDIPLYVENVDVPKRQLRRLGVSVSNIPSECRRPS